MSIKNERNPIAEYNPIMAAPGQTIEIPLKLRLSAEAGRTLAQRAAEEGTDIGAYVSAIVERSTHEPRTVEEISGPVYQRFLESGTTDEQLSEELEQAKHEMRAERRARRAS